MSIVAVHGPNTFGSKAITEVGPAQAVLTTPPGNDGLRWTFQLDQPSTRTTSLAWNFGAGSTPGTATGPGPHSVVYTGPGAAKTVTATATGAGEGANPYPPAGVTTIPITTHSTGQVGSPMMVTPEQQSEGGPSEEEGEYDPGEHTVAEVKEWAEDINRTDGELLAAYDAEVEGKNRTTVLTHLGSLLPYDPADYSVPDVVQYAEDNPDQLDDIIEAEQAGKNRSTLISHLESMRD